ncbi:hypothetical protein [Sinorhizobium fredii]|uniref:hypothetical protein n=1 Tax=Rhizobium fredii TaxID=380 RepID=UPI0005B37200|nr:hypothetical protein [Sinorhizobium fredii]
MGRLKVYDRNVHAATGGTAQNGFNDQAGSGSLREVDRCRRYRHHQAASRANRRQAPRSPAGSQGA